VILYPSPKANLFIEWNIYIRVTICLVHHGQFLSCSLASVQPSRCHVLLTSVLQVCLHKSQDNHNVDYRYPWAVPFSYVSSCEKTQRACPSLGVSTKLTVHILVGDRISYLV
jgi:hypothetical protein